MKMAHKSMMRMAQRIATGGVIEGIEDLDQ